jgi:hypothetical protein
VNLARNGTVLLSTGLLANETGVITLQTPFQVTEYDVIALTILIDSPIDIKQLVAYVDPVLSCIRLL